MRVYQIKYSSKGVTRLVICRAMSTIAAVNTLLGTLPKQDRAFIDVQAIKSMPLNTPCDLVQLIDKLRPTKIDYV